VMLARRSSATCSYFGRLVALIAGPLRSLGSLFCSVHHGARHADPARWQVIGASAAPCAYSCSESNHASPDFPPHRGFGAAAILADSADWAAISWPPGTAANPSTVGRTANRSASAAVTFAADADDSTWCPAPLCAITRRNRPAAAGIDSNVVTLIAPADWPAMVTASGSPPNAATFSRTQRSAATRSSRPRFAGAPLIAGPGGPAAADGTARGRRPAIVPPARRGSARRPAHPPARPAPRRTGPATC